MKKATLFIFLILLATWQTTWACEVCKKNQPAGLENITHGAGPDGPGDYIISWIAVLVVGVTLFLSIKYLVSPKENSPNHIKNIVLEYGSER